jgi:hypothetical protein
VLGVFGAWGGGLCVPVTAARGGLLLPVSVCLRVVGWGNQERVCVAVGITYCNHYMAASNAALTDIAATFAAYAKVEAGLHASLCV